jgi:hypothetical protein
VVPVLLPQAALPEGLAAQHQLALFPLSAGVVAVVKELTARMVLAEAAVALVVAVAAAWVKLACLVRLLAEPLLVALEPSAELEALILEALTIWLKTGVLVFMVLLVAVVAVGRTATLLEGVRLVAVKVREVLGLQTQAAVAVAVAQGAEAITALQAARDLPKAVAVAQGAEAITALQAARDLPAFGGLNKEGKNELRTH